MGKLTTNLKKKLICAEGEPKALFKEEPSAILEGIRMAAEKDLDIELQTFEAMKENAPGLAAVGIDVIRDKFEDILSAEHGARGLRMAVAAEVMPYVLGEAWPPKSRYEIDQFNGLLENLDVTRPDIEYRFPMLFMCFDEKRAIQAIDHLGFDRETAEMYKIALKKVQDLYFVVKPHDFKKFLYLNGKESYEYWEVLAKQQRKLYDHPENRIMSRYYMLQEFKQLKMAIYPEDLAVDADDLIAAGVPTDKVGYILEKLLYRVHYFPRRNTREYLLSEAKRCSRNPLGKFFRDVHFFR